MCGLLETGHEHTDKTNRREVGNRTDHLFILLQWNFKLIPYGIGSFTVAQSDRLHLLVGNIVLSYLQILATQRNVVLIIAFIFIQRIVLIDVLHIRHTSR